MKQNDIAKINASEHGFQCEGKWNILHLQQLNQNIASLPIPQEEILEVDGSQIQMLDSSGALVLSHLLDKLETQNKTINLKVFARKWFIVYYIPHTRQNRIPDYIPKLWFVLNFSYHF